MRFYLPFFPLAGQFVVQPSFFQALSFLSSTLPEVFLWAVEEKDIWANNGQFSFPDI